MRNIKLTIEYDGTNYCGWQIQPNAPTIQGTIRDALIRITKTDVSVTGAGRTDAGVHASGQAANFHTDATMPAPAFQKALNALLPSDITIVNAEEVDESFHARYSAISRVYRYTILNRAYPSALMRNLVYFVPRHLDISKMAAMCEVVVGTRDFSSFQRTGSGRKNPVCSVSEARCWQEEDFVYVQIEADSFLRGMVRAFVGTLLKLNEESDATTRFTEILNAHNRVNIPSAPAQGLCLKAVNYLDSE